jgi:polysaccharide pyruvyl transferase WcaK-like protein
MRVIAPFGFYGCGNIGDEATLQGFARLVELSGKRMQVSVGSRNPAHTRRIEPTFRYFRSDRRDWRRWLMKRLSSAVVVAGGTPIMDCLGKWPLCEVTPLVEEADHRGRPVAFIGIGTERLERDESRRIVGERLAPCVRRWSVRSTRDQERLVECGVPSERIMIAADMAWLLDPVSPDWGQNRLRDWNLASQERIVGVNLVAEKASLDREPQLFDKVAQFLDTLIENHGVFVLFLANEIRDEATFDMAAAEKARASMRHAAKTFIAPNTYLSPQEMQSLVANCHMTVSMRYHFCLFSALQNIPVIALERSDKVTDLCSDLGWSFRTNLHGLREQGLAEIFREVDARRDRVIANLRISVAALKERAIQNLAALRALDDSEYEIRRATAISV